MYSQCWQSISAGGLFTLGIKTNGTLWVWGKSGIININTVYYQVQIGSDNDWQSVSAGYKHSVATKTDVTLWSWGRNSNGQLGDGTNVRKFSPIQVASSINNWQSASAGASHSIAITTNRDLMTWGANHSGAL